jgi:hypothetical protein
MAVLSFDTDSLMMPADEARSVARSLHDRYTSAEPYPHICLDDFLPAEIPERVLHELEQLPEAQHSFSRPQENLKSNYSPERLPLYTRRVIQMLNSRAFLLFLEDMTGIKGLIPDPYHAGGGVHVVSNGGHLDIHADFNYHEKLNLERRLNVLVYLNKDWQPEWGGSFEIWDREMTHKVESFTPVFNRMVCFSTSSDSWHGNPEPVNHPEGQSRKSIALYYYTATWDGTRRKHTTLFRPRPGTADKPDKEIARWEFIEDVLPPIVFRRVAGPLRRLGL